MRRSGSAPAGYFEVAVLALAVGMAGAGLFPSRAYALEAGTLRPSVSFHAPISVVPGNAAYISEPLPVSIVFELPVSPEGAALVRAARTQVRPPKVTPPSRTPDVRRLPRGFVPDRGTAPPSSL